MYEEIPIELFFVSNKNVRKTLNSDDEIESNLETLTQDIKTNGLINPLSVRKINDKYEIYAGQRRFKAIQNLKWEKIPCIINDYDDKKIELLSLAENIQRNRMNNVDKCNIFTKYYELNNKSIDKVAKITSLRPTTIKNYIFIKENLNSDLLPKLDETGTEKLPIETAKDLCKNIIDKTKQKEVYEKTKNLQNTDKKKEAIEKIKKNPDKDIDEIINESEDSETDDEGFNFKQPWIFDFENKGNKINIPSKYFEAVFKLIKNNSK
jgi:ParB family chromosome partitioning protein